MKSQILNQYKACFTMLKSCIERYSDSVWYDKDNHETAAYEIAYHAIACTNLCSAPSEDGMVRWAGEADPDKHRFSQSEMVDYIEHVLRQIPVYLQSFSPEEDCWPDWYNLNQHEFHINSLRHVQHHAAELIERHRSTKDLSVEWLTFQ